MATNIDALFPAPRIVVRTEGSYTLGSTLALSLPEGWQEDLTLELTSIAQHLKSFPNGTTRVSIIRGDIQASPSEQAYELDVIPDGVRLVARSVEGARFGLRTLKRLLGHSPIPCCQIQDWPNIQFRGVQIDIGRVIERPEVVERLLELYASFNYNVLQFYLENAFVFPSHPSLARPFAWTLEQAAKVVDTAAQYGITVIPAIQSLGHSSWVTSNPVYAELDECCERGEQTGVLCPSHPRTHEMLSDMIRDVAPLATSGIIHIGMDESFYIGRCSRCAPLRQEIGEGGIYVSHANRVANYVRDVGKRPAIWGDMFYYHPDRAVELDKGILIFDWYYYVFEHRPRIELFGFPEVDSLALWKKNGLDVWGCPVSVFSGMLPVSLPEESIGNARSWVRYLKEYEQKGIMVTQWELATSSIDVALPVEGAMAGFLWGNSDAECSELLTDACRVLFNRPALAPLLEEMGHLRLHGYCTRQWVFAPTLSEMVTYTSSDQDKKSAARLDEISREIAVQAVGAKNEDMVLAYVPAARWLAYQYRKHAWLDEAAILAIEGKYDASATRFMQLRSEANELAEAWQTLWNKNRYADDKAPHPERLRQDAELFAVEENALKAAASGRYSGELTKPKLAVHIVNTHPAIPAFQVATSPDGEIFTERGHRFILQFDSCATSERSDDELTYTFAVDSIEDARFVKVTAMGGWSVLPAGDHTSLWSQALGYQVSQVSRREYRWC